MRMKRMPNSSDPFQGTYSLSKTAGTGLIILGFIVFVAMFFLLQKNKPEGAENLPYYLPWCIGYGIPCLLCAGTGVYWILHDIKRPYDCFIFSIICFVFAGFGIGGSIPFGVVWQNVEFIISGIVIAACEAVIAFLTIRSYQERK